jgi:MFS family permease
MTDPTRAKVQFGLIFFAHALGAMSVLSVLTAGPALVSALGLTAVQLGGLASVYSAALAAASLPAGLVTDRLGTRTALSVAALIIASGLVVAATAQGVVQLGAGMALCGAGYGLINPAAGLAVTLWFTPKWRTTLLSLKQTGVPAGAALGSLTALLAPVWGWQAGILCAAAVTLLACLLFVLFLPPKASHTVRRGSPGHSRLAEVLALPGLGRANLVAGLTNGIQFALWAHVPDLLQRSYASSGAALLGLSLAALHLGTFAGRVAWGALTDRHLRGNAAHALWWLCLMGLAGVAALGASAVIAHPFPAVLACFLLGFTACSAVGLHVALTARIAPDYLLGGAMGYTMLFTNLGGIIVPLVLGLAISLAGMGGAALTFAVLLGLALALLVKFQ